MTSPQNPDLSAVDNKVKASTSVTLLASLGFALANAYSSTAGVLDPLPQAVQFPLLVLLPVLATFLAGYATPSQRVG